MHAAEALDRRLEDATRQFSDQLSIQVSCSTHVTDNYVERSDTQTRPSIQLSQALRQLNEQLEHNIYHRLSNAVETIDTRVTIPIEAARELVDVLQIHADALQLAIRDQHGAVLALTTATGDLVTHQRMNQERLDGQLHELRQIQSSFGSIGHDLNTTHADIRSLLHTQQSSSGLFDSAVVPLERLAYSALTEFARGHNFSSHFANCKCT